MKTKDYVIMLVIAALVVWASNNISFVKSTLG